VLSLQQVKSINTWIEFPEVVEVSVQACVVATKYIQLAVVADCGE